MWDMNKCMTQIVIITIKVNCLYKRQIQRLTCKLGKEFIYAIIPGTNNASYKSKILIKNIM